MAYEDSIRVVNLLIRDHVVRHNYDGNIDSPVHLASRRCSAKFEEPRNDKRASRRIDAWSRWINFDEGIPNTGILGPHWALARLWVHQCLSKFSMGELAFTDGSSFEPLGNRTSVACKLTGEWTITADCFELYAKYSYWHRALKHAVKKRFKSYCRNQKLNIRLVNRKLWARYGNNRDAAFRIYSFKLFCIVKFVNGNRWSTVPKNNLKDRSICLEPLCNMLVQRALGLGIRHSLNDYAALDLNNLADVHRLRISDQKVATIDLSDCSDAISMRLIKYLLPSRIFKLISSCRSDMTLGPDDNYYLIKKVSSMGNGFTFDLMTLVLTALTRSFDATSSVFGDDIICQNQYAEDIVSNLRIAGFNINSDKTYINSHYRESCGAHFIDGHGYVTSFDFKWVTSMQELITTINKVAILASIYGGPYEALRAEIWSRVPRTLLGAATIRLVADVSKPPQYNLSDYVRYGPPVDCEPNRHIAKVIRRKLKHLHKYGNLSIAHGYVCQSLPPRKTLKAEDWDVYFQNIRSIYASRRIPRLVIKSSIVARVGEEQIGFVRSLCP